MNGAHNTKTVEASLPKASLRTMSSDAAALAKNQQPEAEVVTLTTPTTAYVAADFEAPKKTHKKILWIVVGIVVVIGAGLFFWLRGAF